MLLGFLAPLSLLRRGGRVLALLLALLLATLPAHALEPDDLTLTVTPELAGNAPPYAREMVLLKLRGVYRTQILLEEVRQPALTNFSWTQLGRDTWGRTRMPDGQMALLFERTIAIFPQHTGTFVIEPFTHKLTINDNGERRTVDVRSEAIPFPVAKWTGESGGPDAPEPWWLPARDVAITDSWDPDPETINQGDTTRRIVTLEAQGMLAEGLPPRPVMRTRGIVTFAGPVKRETIITPTGPVARATYQWDLKKGVAEVIALEGIEIPWFDTVSRTMRVAEIPARQIGGGSPDREEDLKARASASWAAIGGAGFAAFGLGLVLIGLGTGRRVLRLGRADRLALKRAAASGDAVAFRAALGRWMQAEPELAEVWHADSESVAALSALDRSVYGTGGTTPLDLGGMATLFSKRRKLAASALAEEPKLAPLDGRGLPAR
ncbi:BatD family protein [Methylobacterium haplocladii]|uniref:BatD family protein n=1 Tax=Methylobacterium haplocladii TaxID=1176176 RepID=UPI0011BE0ADD|nr:BatD family protein [Methylobacterium haplocladii]